MLSAYNALKNNLSALLFITRHYQDYYATAHIRLILPTNGNIVLGILRDIYNLNLGSKVPMMIEKVSSLLTKE